MIRLDLTDEQTRSVRNGAGSVDLTEPQALYVRAKVTARGAGRKATCSCGVCPKCRNRQRKRVYRAGSVDTATAAPA